MYVLYFFLFLEMSIQLIATNVQDPRTAIFVFPQATALPAIKCITDPDIQVANDAIFSLFTERAIFTYSNLPFGPHVGVANGAFAITFFTEKTCLYARLLQTHY